MALVRKRNRKVEVPVVEAPYIPLISATEPAQVEPDAARHAGALHAAAPDESPESHPGKFDTFGNPH